MTIGHIFSSMTLLQLVFEDLTIMIHEFILYIFLELGIPITVMFYRRRTFPLGNCSYESIGGTHKILFAGSMNSKV